MTLSYDKHADVLYIAFEALSPDKYVFVENEQGDVLKLDRIDNHVVGCTIPFFLARLKKGKIDIPEIGGGPLNEIAELVR